MKQFQIMVEKDYALQTWLKQIRSYCERSHVFAGSMLFRLYSDTIDEAVIRPVLARIKEAFPDAACAGSTSGGNIVHGSLVDAHVSVTCTIFEDPDTRVRIVQLPMSRISQKESVEKLLSVIDTIPDLKAVEIMTTMSNVDMPAFCSALHTIDDTVRIYGGGANACDVVNGDVKNTFVFSNKGEIARYSAVFILLSGRELHVSTRYLTGWSRIGRNFRVTAAKDNILLELEHRPALEIYQKYLGIPTDEHFFKLANVFPLYFGSKGDSYMRIVTSWNDDGSLRLGGFIEDEQDCCITYGDPGHILSSLEDCFMHIRDFSPHVIQLFSCVARKFFWGSATVSQETLPFEILSPVSGYYTSGEFLRTRENVRMHNSTIVVVAMREGNPEVRTEAFQIYGAELSHHMRVGNCLAVYVNALADEMQ